MILHPSLLWKTIALCIIPVAWVVSMEDEVTMTMGMIPGMHEAHKRCPVSRLACERD